MVTALFRNRKHSKFWFCFLGSIAIHALVLPLLPGFFRETAISGKAEQIVIQATLVPEAKRDVVEEKPILFAEAPGAVSSVKTEKIIAVSHPEKVRNVPVRGKKVQTTAQTVSFGTVPALSVPSLRKKVDWNSVHAVTASYAGNAPSLPSSDFRSTAREDYIQTCREKIFRTGTMSNFAKFDGRVVVRISIDKTGSLLDISAEVSDEMPNNLRDAALDVVRKSAPFAEFPDLLVAETNILRFSVGINFVSQK